jgi:hypothetical protein
MKKSPTVREIYLLFIYLSRSSKQKKKTHREFKTRERAQPLLLAVAKRVRMQDQLSRLQLLRGVMQVRGDIW